MAGFSFQPRRVRTSAFRRPPAFAFGKRLAIGGTGGLAGGRVSTSRSSRAPGKLAGFNSGSGAAAGGSGAGTGSSGGDGFVSSGVQVGSVCSGWGSEMGSFGNSPRRAFSLSNSSTDRKSTRRSEERRVVSEG